MCAIATYVFFDLETTGLPRQENNRTKITELSFVAVKRKHLLTTPSNTKTPRVQNKITLCFNPQKMINFESTEKTGLSNELLEHEAPFDKNAFCLLNTFLEALTDPICLIAYNGNKFDFPILRNRLEKLNAKFSDDIMCADSFFCFYDLTANNHCPESPSSSTTNTSSTNNTLDMTSSQISDFFNENSLDMKLVNENTPQKQMIRNGNPKRNHISKARRRFPWSEKNRPKDSYELTEVYKRLVCCEPKQAHNAEGDCLLMLECSVVLGNKFVQWVDSNCEKFSSIKPMTVGVPLGL